MAGRKKSAIRDMKNAANDIGDGGGLDKRTGKLAGEGIGGAAGALGGAAIGSLAGPIGTIIGAIAGATGGWWAGKNVAEQATGFDNEDSYYRNRFDTASTPGSSVTYDNARPAYQLGYLAAQNPGYSGRSFAEIEPDLKRGWSEDVRRQYGSWDNARPFVAEAFEREFPRKITRAEEELAVGKRPGHAGEVELQKAVETEHLTERAPLTREEGTVERRPVNDDSELRS